MQKRAIGVSNLPNLVHSQFILRGSTFNIMVAGSRGLGKTTFLNQFLGSKVLESQPFEVENGNDYYYLEGQCNIQTSYIEILEGEFLTRLNITEVDGLGDSIDNTKCYEPVVKLLEKNFEDYYEKFSKSVKSEIDDKRVHLCVYFLEPISTIKIADLEALKAISKYCVVIPVIAKADLIPSTMISQIRMIHRNILLENSVPLFNERESEGEQPFFIFSQDRIDNSGYCWSNFPIQGCKLNDFLILKRMILEKSISTIKTETDRFYDNYRVFSMLFKNPDDGVIKYEIEKKIEKYQERLEVLKSQILEAKNLKRSENIAYNIE